MGFLSKLFSKTSDEVPIIEKKGTPIGACPNCGVVLEKMPTRKSKCKECGKTIYLKDELDGDGKALIGEDQIEDYELESNARRENDTIKELVVDLTEVSEKKLDSYIEKFLQDNPNHKYFDACWRYLDKYTASILKKGLNENSLQKLSGIYFRQGLYLSQREQKGWRALKAAADEMDVREISINEVYEGVKEVELKADGCCYACDSLDGESYKIEDLLKDRSKYISNSCTSDWCTCRYWAPLDDQPRKKRKKMTEAEYNKHIEEKEEAEAKKSPYYFYNLYSKRISEGDLDDSEAIDILLKAADKDVSENTVANIHKALGARYENIEDSKSAIFHYEKALKINPKIGVLKKLNKLKDSK